MEMLSQFMPLPFEGIQGYCFIKFQQHTPQPWKDHTDRDTVYGYQTEKNITNFRKDQN